MDPFKEHWISRESVQVHTDSRYEQAIVTFRMAPREWETVQTYL